jgi:hypothetical protein
MARAGGVIWLSSWAYAVPAKLASTMKTASKMGDALLLVIGQRSLVLVFERRGRRKELAVWFATGPFAALAKAHELFLICSLTRSQYTNTLSPSLVLIL